MFMSSETNSAMVLKVNVKSEKVIHRFYVDFLNNIHPLINFGKKNPNHLQY